MTEPMLIDDLGRGAVDRASNLHAQCLDQVHDPGVDQHLDDAVAGWIPRLRDGGP